MNTFNSRLEEVLALAATEPAHRPAFFSQLLEASVLVPGTRADGGDGPLDASTPLDLQHWEKEDGTSVIPFFTSEQALADAVSDAQPYVILPVRTLFALTQGETLFLNPKLPSGKEFTPAEIARLIDEGGSALTQQTVLEGGSALLLSEVAAPPAQMIASLTTLFSQTKPVRRAFVALLREQADGPANLLIGIEADSDIATIIHTAGQVATDTLTDDAPIDICQVVEGEGGISHFFSAHITPFYERRWGSFLRDIKVKMV
ncbi:enhanced serine sensitivity protein SseB [Pantoea sp. 1.19]|uniref:enhanced serine sensitivity protein SseB n=1 Tax=Pantoea sp. 1.19 TaxID=1925589 RepID=UPI00094900E4|nr:enhanced serine sensitivity protein SseB [Pantoea sp. 1.19]